MALTSPRFVTSTRLRNAAAGAAIRKHARGRAVHLVQMALIDLGYAMPRSIGRPGYSPDGQFGDETQQRLQEFQDWANINPSGIIDRGTIMALDHFCPGSRHRVRLHFRSISLARVPFDRSLSDTQRVYGQYGIAMEFASGESLGLTEAEERALTRVDGECNWVLNAGEYNRLHGMGSRAPSNEILVYYVRRFADPSLLGCGGHAANRPACTVAARASRWDTAHEIGHVLLTSAFAPVHPGHQRNLMYAFSSNSARMPVLTDRQVAKIRRSPCCVAA